jgi:multidrug efflux pump subunit AcrA (membrane-fusion protein)
MGSNPAQAHDDEAHMSDGSRDDKTRNVRGRRSQAAPPAHRRTTLPPPFRARPHAAEVTGSSESAPAPAPPTLPQQAEQPQGPHGTPSPLVPPPRPIADELTASCFIYGPPPLPEDALLTMVHDPDPSYRDARAVPAGRVDFGPPPMPEEDVDELDSADLFPMLGYGPPPLPADALPTTLHHLPDLGTASAPEIRRDQPAPLRVTLGPRPDPDLDDPSPDPAVDLDSKDELRALVISLGPLPAHRAPSETADGSMPSSFVSAGPAPVAVSGQIGHRRYPSPRAHSTISPEEQPMWPPPVSVGQVVLPGATHSAPALTAAPYGAAAVAPGAPGGAGPLLLPHQASRVFDSVRRLALQNDLPGATQVIRHSIAQLTASERVHCLLRDPASGALWSIDEDAPRTRPADHPGVTTFAARTGTPVAAAHADESPLYRAELDDPEGDGSERMLIQPVSSAGAVIAVIAAVRRGSAQQYTPAERLAAAAFAEQCAPIVQHFALDHHLRSLLPEGEQVARPRPETRARQAPTSQAGEVLRLSPSWVRWGYAVLIAAVAGGLLFAAIAKVHRYSAGPAVVRLDGAGIAAAEPGTVAAVRVSAGQRVRQGDLLVELQGSAAGDLAAIELAHENQLAAFVLDPSDETARRGLAEATTRLDQARTRVAERSARAPRDGVIADLRVRPGMQLAAGDHLMTVTDETAAPIVVALLPGDHRSELAVGKELRLDLPGYRRAKVRAVVEEVGAVVGPREARRYLGADLGNAVLVAGPVVVVKARITERGVTGGQAFQDGMVGTGEVEIGSRRVLSALIPGGDD